MAKRRDDGPWRREVIARRGDVCRSCGDFGRNECDHIWPRSQGGPSVVENGLVLCGPWSRTTPGGCHSRKTESSIVIDPSWLDEDQIAWLAEVGWVAWDQDGEPYGRGWRHFAPMRGA